MKLSLSISAAALAAVSTAASNLHLEKRDSPAVISLPFSKKQAAPVPSTKRKRAGVIPIPDTNYQHSILYMIEVAFGTPPQSTLGQFDTGSPSFIVETVTDNLCTAVGSNPCSEFGGYNANASSTYQYISSDLDIEYGGGDGASGDRAYDVAAVGGATLTGMYMGLMYKTTVQEGVYGALYTEAERDQTTYNPPRTNLIQLLRDQGYTASRAFSLWTNDIGADGGTILFGGIDTSKYAGSLVSMDLVPGIGGTYPVTDFFRVPVLSVSGSVGGKVTTTFDSTGIPDAILDSGTTVMLLEVTLAQAVWDFVGATPFSAGSSAAYAPCSLATSTNTIDFSFPGVTIHVPFSQLFFLGGIGDGVNCQLTVSKANENILGDTFLSSAYVVFDLDNHQVHLAQAVYNPGASNVLQITAGPNGVPNAPGVGGTSSSSSQSSTSTSTKTSTTSSKSSTASTTKTSTTSKSSTSTSKSSTVSSTKTSTKTSTTTSKSSTSTSKSSSSSTKSTLTTSTKTSTSSTKTTSKSSTITPKPTLVCKANNCLRELYDARFSSKASAFCSTYTTTINLAPSAIPTYLENCQSNVSMVSSACSCIIAEPTPTP